MRPGDSELRGAPPPEAARGSRVGVSALHLYWRSPVIHETCSWQITNPRTPLSHSESEWHSPNQMSLRAVHTYARIRRH